MKKCNKCKEEKPLSEFNKNKSRKDGLSYKCKGCDREQSKTHRQNNKDYFKEYFKTHYQNNKEQYNKYNKTYIITRYHNDPQFKLKYLLRDRIYKSIKNRSNSSQELLGCDIETYYNYLEKQFTKDMTWDNHGKVWEIDHTIPLNTFDLEDEGEQFKAFNYRNTRPLPITENRSRPKDGSDLV